MYTVFLRLYRLGISVASVFNHKAKLWISGRQNLLERLKSDLRSNTSEVIWMHCASLGEFEQGRTVLEGLKNTYPHKKILLTFFSPSGYEIRKNYAFADWVYYLPLDTRQNAATFTDIVNPSLVVFVKYEYWYNFLHELHVRKIPTILISAIFTENSIFFKNTGTFHRKMLGFFSHIFVQNKESKKRLSSILPADKITVAGDTRFDRVEQIAINFEPLPQIEEFIGGRNFVLVAGSTWPKDEENLKNTINFNDRQAVLIIAPHEINKSHISELQAVFPEAILFSELEKNPDLTGQILIIDNIGMLSRLYYYANFTYIGGGFNKSGIHNTLEAAVFSKPVIFGPNYEKFSEAINLIKNKGGFSYQSANQLEKIIKNLNSNPGILNNYGENAGRFVKENTGATKIILDYIQANLR